VTISGTNTANNNIIFASDYYPFGETLREYTTGTNKYKFTEKERDAESGYDYFGARYYNNKLGVWMSADPLADKYPGFSPFNYCVNNPLRLVDPVGMSFSDFTTVTSQANWNGDKNDEHYDNSPLSIGWGVHDGEKNGGNAGDKWNTLKTYNFPYKTIEAAGLAAHKYILSKSSILLPIIEYGCLIIRNGENYGITNFIDGIKENWDIPESVLDKWIEKGAVALFHLHREENRLSYPDRISGLNMKISVFAGLPNGKLEMFDYRERDYSN
jgi:RHS repeat-associated protein